MPHARAQRSNAMKVPSRATSGKSSLAFAGAVVSRRSPLPSGGGDEDRALGAVGPQVAAERDLPVLGRRGGERRGRGGERADAPGRDGEHAAGDGGGGGHRGLPFGGAGGGPPAPPPPPRTGHPHAR